MTITPVERQWLDNLTRQTQRDVDETLAFRVIALQFQREQQCKQRRPDAPPYKS